MQEKCKDTGRPKGSWKYGEIQVQAEPPNKMLLLRRDVLIEMVYLELRIFLNKKSLANSSVKLREELNT